MHLSQRAMVSLKMAGASLAVFASHGFQCTLWDLATGHPSFWLRNGKAKLSQGNPLRALSAAPLASASFMRILYTCALRLCPYVCCLFSRDFPCWFVLKFEREHEPTPIFIFPSKMTPIYMHIYVYLYTHIYIYIYIYDRHSDRPRLGRGDGGRAVPSGLCPQEPASPEAWAREVFWDPADQQLGPPAIGALFYRFFFGWEGSKLLKPTETSWCPCFNLSTGGPRKAFRHPGSK